MREGLSCEARHAGMEEADEGHVETRIARSAHVARLREHQSAKIQRTKYNLKLGGISIVHDYKCPWVIQLSSDVRETCNRWGLARMRRLAFFLALFTDVKQFFAFVPHICEARRLDRRFKSVTDRGGVNVRGQQLSSGLEVFLLGKVVFRIERTVETMDLTQERVNIATDHVQRHIPLVYVGSTSLSSRRRKAPRKSRGDLPKDYESPCKIVRICELTNTSPIWNSLYCG